MPGTQLSWERAELPGDRVSSEMREKYLDTNSISKKEKPERVPVPAHPCPPLEHTGVECGSVQAWGYHSHR